MPTPTSQADAKVFAAHQSALWRQLTAQLGRIYRDIEQNYLLTPQILAKLRGAAIEVRIGGNTLYLRWTSSYAFRPGRRVKFTLTDSSITRFVALSSSALTERLDTIGCAKRPAPRQHARSNKEA